MKIIYAKGFDYAIKHKGKDVKMLSFVHAIEKGKLTALKEFNALFKKV